MDTPAMVVSKTCSMVPLYRETSVDVPPISNPMTGIGFFFFVTVPFSSSDVGVPRYEVLAYPTTPPRSAQYRLMSAKIGDGGQSSVGLHEVQSHFLHESVVESLGESGEVFHYLGRQVRRRAGRVTTGHHLDHAHDLVQQTDFRKALDLDENFQRAKDGLETAQKRQKQASKRDYYKILGLKRNCNKRDVAKAYRKLAQKWHPDNFQDEEEKKKAEKKFMDIAAAKEVLSDEGTILLNYSKVALFHCPE